jgi:putative addiction module killer protein
MTYTIERTDIFNDWLDALKDDRARAKIITRLTRAQNGNLGDHKSVGGGISEMRINEGKGYRLYYTIRDSVLIVMLVGGDKSSQQADIRKARQMREEMKP